MRKEVEDLGGGGSDALRCANASYRLGHDQDGAGGEVDDAVGDAFRCAFLR